VLHNTTVQPHTQRPLLVNVFGVHEGQLCRGDGETPVSVDVVYYSTSQLSIITSDRTNDQYLPLILSTIPPTLAQNPSANQTFDGSW